jgi:IS5 family transposase
MDQMSFSDAEYGTKRKQTRREKFLAEMDQVIPWQRLGKRIEPFYRKTGGRPPYPLSVMLRIHLMQHWYGLSDPAMEDALYEITSMRQFAGLSLSTGRIPDETTILNFRHLLEEHQLGQALFNEVRGFLDDHGLLLKSGTIVDASLIDAPSSTKNKEGKRDPEMHQTRKGNQWYFGMKMHIGVDDMTGVVHSLVSTAANVNDVTQAGHLLHGEEERAFGDAGYQGVEKRPEHKDRQIDWHIALRPGKRRALGNSELDQLTEHIEQSKASMRAIVEHPFRVIKRQFGFTKVRYRGLAKNDNALHTLFALCNLYMKRRVLAVA